MMLIACQYVQIKLIYFYGFLRNFSRIFSTCSNCFKTDSLILVLPFEKLSHC